MKQPRVLCSCSQLLLPAELTGLLSLQVDLILPAPAVTEDVTHVLLHFVARVHVSAHKYSTVHNLSLAKALPDGVASCGEVEDGIFQGEALSVGKGAPRDERTFL